MDEIGLPTQSCRICGETRPLGHFDLRADIGRPTSMCKDCRRGYQLDRWRRSHPPVERRPRRVGVAAEFLCTRCGKTKSAEAFPPRRRDGAELQHWCRDCFAELNAKRYVDQRDHERIRLYRNRERRIMERREWLRGFLDSHPCVDCGADDPIVLEFDHVKGKSADVTSMIWQGAPWHLVEVEIAKCEIRCGNCHRRRTHERRAMRRTLRISRSMDTVGSKRCTSCHELKPLETFTFRCRADLTRQAWCRACHAARDRARSARLGPNVTERRGQARQPTSEIRRQVDEILGASGCIDCGVRDRIVLEFDHVGPKRANVSDLLRRSVGRTRVLEEIAMCEVRCVNCHKRATAARRRPYTRSVRVAATPEGIEPSPSVP